jgi:hypothetical protein
MTIKELKEQLEGLDETMEVVLNRDCSSLRTVELWESRTVDSLSPILALGFRTEE